MTLRIVLIEDDYGDAELVRAYLEDDADHAFILDHAPLLEDGVKLLEEGGADVALLDLNLPDSSGLTTFTSLRARFQDIPIIVLSGLDDREISTMAVREGAQDFIVKGNFDGKTLFRAILHAIERHQLYRQLVGAALSDELTGLCNRRGFLALAGQMFKSAQRLARGAFLLYVDLDGMKSVNDGLGHREGDRMLKDMADILRDCFREADVVARLGGDEFAVFGLQETHLEAVEPKERLLGKIAAFNAASGRPFTLAASIGLSCLDLDCARRLEDLLACADARMYEEKRTRSNRSAPRRQPPAGCLAPAAFGDGGQGQPTPKARTDIPRLPPRIA
ncbi:MAG: diguanylate cyclase (GGDEF) domain-containing protein [Solidesulfovibrio magneticus str. Maddingley MBC34]|uniref:diguanylate cyclase n=1 Tax=Solidesulfovibrio magneticus str. Maddingley MBC34 TaxID=1206767 RepID=K6HEE8_9BACT|nr:MAG: diguanylate cyclase (GGDEF) domain-containing protein [Solidesulfovibrio magneticus str. Maddingley MBC34]